MSYKTIAAIGLIMMVSLLTSCSSNKVQTASYPEYTGIGNTGPRIVNKVEDEIDDCEQMELDAPAGEWRAYASSIDEDRDFARQQALLFAKAELISRIEALTLNVFKGYRDKVKGNGIVTSGTDLKQDVGSMSELMVRNCKILCSKRYRLSDGTYECAVCISVPATEVEQIVGAAVKAEDERQKVEHNAEQFRKSYSEDYKEFRERQKNNR